MGFARQCQAIGTAWRLWCVDHRTRRGRAMLGGDGDRWRWAHRLRDAHGLHRHLADGRRLAPAPGGVIAEV
jgi:hypothetical protein